MNISLCNLQKVSQLCKRKEKKKKQNCINNELRPTFAVWSGSSQHRPEGGRVGSWSPSPCLILNVSVVKTQRNSNGAVQSEGGRGGVERGGG